MSNNSFKPAWWLPGPHLQTLWPSLCRRVTKKMPSKRERIELPDGDFVDIDWLGKEEGPIVLVLHGLEGSIDSPYAKGMLHAVTKQGWRGLLLHFRGCSGEPNRLPRSYHSGDTSDLDYVIKLLRMREPKTPIGAIGFSLGGNVLLKWMGEKGKDNTLTAAVAISVPFELHKSAQRIQRGFSKLYEKYFLRCLRTRFGSKFTDQLSPLDLKELAALKSLREFDDKITAPLHGFAGVNQYYALSNSRNYLSNIQIPTLILQSMDDPLMSADSIPSQHELPEQVILQISPSGGHVGFVTGNLPWKPQYWLEERAPQFLQTFLPQMQEALDEAAAAEQELAPSAL